jgi:hypothetical protein
MSINDDHVKLLTRVLKKLINRDIVDLDYDEPVGCMNIIKKGTNEPLLSIATSEDKTPNSYSIDIDSEEGFDLFYDIFPTAKRLDIKSNMITSDKFRFMEAYLCGRCFSDVFDSIDYYKHFHDSVFSGEHYIFQTFQTEDPQNLGFHYYYSINLDLKSIEVVSQVIYYNSILTPDITIILNDEFDIDDLIQNIIFDNAAKKLKVDLENLKLSDAQILHMFHI